MRPHCSPRIDGTIDRRSRDVARNIDRFVTGELLENIVTTTWELGLVSQTRTTTLFEQRSPGIPIGPTKGRFANPSQRWGLRERREAAHLPDSVGSLEDLLAEPTLGALGLDGRNRSSCPLADILREFRCAYSGLRDVASDAFDRTLITAAQLDDVVIRVADED
jgi:hypothetical protein